MTKINKETYYNSASNIYIYVYAFHYAHIILFSLR